MHPFAYYVPAVAAVHAENTAVITNTKKKTLSRSQRWSLLYQNPHKRLQLLAGGDMVRAEIEKKIFPTDGKKTG